MLARRNRLIVNILAHATSYRHSALTVTRVAGIALVYDIPICLEDK